jgi:elongation factor 2
LAEDL